ncbi:MAG: DNA polymerase III subunit delta [Alphaproteobacteria bacterium]|nr:DNA polymerase III subunit delta [Alphaproteobacteria bacterium]
MKLSGAGARAFLERGDAAMRAALLYGPNRSLVSETAKRLADRALKDEDDPFALTRLADDDLKKDKAALADALAAQSLLGGARVVWVRAENDSNADTIIAALDDLVRAAAYFIVEGGDLGGSSKIVKAFEKVQDAACLAFYEESDAERAAFAREFLSAHGVNLAPDARQHLSDLLPSDRGLVRQELEKLAAFAHNAEAPLTLDAIAPVIAGLDQSDVDEAALAALIGRHGEAMETLARADALSGVSAIKSLQRRVLRLLEARAHMEAGLNAQDAAAKLRPPLFWKERDAFQAQLRLWSTPRLLAAANVLWRAEIAAKTSGAPQELVAADAFRSVARLVG